MNMGSPPSPPVLYLSDDDDDDNEIEQNIPYGHPYSAMINENLPRKKRKLTNTNVRVNPSIVNWSKRQRNDHYHRSRPTPPNLLNHERDIIVMNSTEYTLQEPESHSFLAFDWSSEPRTSTRIHPSSLQTQPRFSMIPPPPPTNVMNVVKHHLDHSDAIPLIPITHQNDRYIQPSPRKSISFPRCTSPPQPLPLPLPTQTSSIIRPTAQRVQPVKNLRIPYTQTASSSPSSSSLLSTRHTIEPIFPRTFQSPCSAPIITPAVTPEIRRQALNGTGTLSAFYDSKCYRCNICKFKSITSSTLLQHLFTHIFFCQHCSFYTYSHHNLYQHVFDKHNYNLTNDDIDPKMLELLYLTRCPDGTFALCMDSSPPKPPTPIPPKLIVVPKPDEQSIKPSLTKDNKKPPKPKLPRKKRSKTKKDEDNDIVVLAEKHDTNPQPSSSSSSSLSIVPKRSTVKEKQPNIYVLMKHRRCYSVKYPPCLHPLTIEYNICREHTIRHMCHTQDVVHRRKYKPKSNIIRLIDEAAKCLKTLVNSVVNMEDNSGSSDLILPLQNSTLNLLFPTDDLNMLTSSLKLRNKYDKAIEENDQIVSEEPIRISNQHVFILSATGVNKNEQSIFASLNSSITSSDTVFTQTRLKKLPTSYDNTHRFLKGSLTPIQQPTTSTITKTSNKNNIPQPTVSEPVRSPIANSSRLTNHSSSPSVDRNNNSVTSSTPSVIVLD